MGNVNWAQKNYTGAVWRYQQILEADPHNTEVLNTLRALKCYIKYYQAAQSAAPVEYDTKVQSNCLPNVGTSPDGQSESRVICKHVSMAKYQYEENIHLPSMLLAFLMSIVM